MKNKEIADILGVSLRTVEAHMYKALKYLRDVYKRQASHRGSYTYQSHHRKISTGYKAFWKARPTFESYSPPEMCIRDSLHAATGYKSDRK